MKRYPGRMLAATVALTLAACGGGGGDPVPAGTCQRAAIPSTGPGDTLHYFPAEVGRTWTYRNESSGQTAVMTVSGTQVVASETASVFTMTSAGSATSTELVVKRPAGVYVLSDQSAEPPFDTLYPSLVLPFPVAPMPETQQATCSALDMGDLDGDLRPDKADVTFTLRVFSVTETAPVAAGTFVDVAHVQSIARVHATATTAGVLDVVVTQDDWFAKDVGRVNSLLTIAVPSIGYSEQETISLQSWTVPSGAALVAAPLAASLGAEPGRPERLEATALRVVREVLAARR